MLAGPLTEAQVQEIRAKNGPNEAEVKRNRFRTLKIFLSAAFGPFNLLLLGIAITTCATGDLQGFIIILTLDILSTLIQFFQEYRSNNIAAKLRQDIGAKTVEVQRFGDEESRPKTLSARDLVVGDIVFLKEGDTVPADMILAESKELRVSEAALNGEEHPKKKKIAPVTKKGQQMIELENIDHGLHLCLMGSAVVSGSGKGIVLHTGRTTIYAGIISDASQEKPSTPFDKGILRITQLLLTLALVMTITVFLIHFLSGKPVLDGLKFAVSVGITVAPELLPVIVNVTQSRAAFMMSKSNTRVSKNKAVINLGCMDVLCMDKTGTITENKVTVAKAVDAKGKDNMDVLRLAYLNSALSDGKMAVENAIITAYEQLFESEGNSSKVEKNDNKDEEGTLEDTKRNFHRSMIYQVIQSTTKIFERGFDSHTRLQGVILSRKGNYELICKGAVDEVLNACVPMTSRPPIESGYRAVAIAKKDLPGTMLPPELEKELDNMTGLTFIGILYLLDQPKKSAKSTIGTLNEQGVKVKMISGDAKETCMTIAREVGILRESPLIDPQRQVISGDEIEKLPLELRAQAVIDAQVFAKMRPRHKKIVVEALKSQGLTVGMIGDGLNDATAIKMADIGITFGGDLAMPACQDLADVVLGGPELNPITDGVNYGRATFYNTVKYTKTQLSGSLSNALSNLIAPWILPFLPMLSTQILLQNLLIDLCLVPLPWDNVDKIAYASPRAWSVKLHLVYMIIMAPIGSAFDMVTFAYFKYAKDCNEPDLGAPLQTGWFVAGVATQALVFHVLRTTELPFIRNRACLGLIISTLGIAAIAMLLPLLPFSSSIFGMVRLDGQYYLVLAGIIFTYCLVVQLIKKSVTKLIGTWL